MDAGVGEQAVTLSFPFRPRKMIVRNIMSYSDEYADDAKVANLASDILGHTQVLAYYSIMRHCQLDLVYDLGDSFPASKMCVFTTNKTADTDMVAALEFIGD